MLKLKQVGFKGFMIDDHVPKMANDSSWNHRGRAYATGYMLGLLQAANSVPAQ
jgi:mannonate dehydratase